MSETITHPLVQHLSLLRERLWSISEKHERKILVVAATIFVLIFCLLGAWKIWSFGYNGLDLAIYRQVMTNSVHGHLFAFTIHPGSFLGDHLELIIVPLLAIFALAPHPLTLILLQAVALAVAIFPLANITKRIVGKPWHLFFALAYLANPIIQNTAIFEFHMLPFAVPLVCFAMVAYLDQKFWKFLLLAVLAMLVREDVSLAIVGIGLLALADHRSRRWSLTPIILGVAWLAAALVITGHFNGSGQYKFLAYYGWLGNSATNLFNNALAHPWVILQHLFSITNLKFLLIFGMPFAFLPLAGRRWLIPAVLTLLQLLLLPITGVLITQIHYSVVLVPFFIMAMAAGWKIISSARPKSFWTTFGGKMELSLITSLFVIYSMLTLGPITQAIPLLTTSPTISDRVHLEHDMVTTLPLGGTVASYEALTALANRPRLYSLHYVFLGHKQFSSETYILPADASIIFMDLRDYLFYQLDYPTNDDSGRQGYARIRNVLAERHFTVTSYVDRFVVLEKNVSAPPSIDIGDPTRPIKIFGATSTHGELDFLGWSSASTSLKTSTQFVAGHAYTTLPFSIIFKKNTTSNSIRPVEFDFSYGGHVVYHQLMPLGGGIFPSSDWPVGHQETSHYNLLVPKHLVGLPLTLSARVMDVNGSVVLNGLRSLVLSYSTYRQLGPTIDLGVLTP